MVETFKASGLRQHELAALCGVTRVTVSHWMTGRFMPGEDAAPRVKQVVDRLTEAINDGKLPLPKSVASHTRVARATELIGLTT